MQQDKNLDIPDVDAFVERPTGNVSAVGTERDAVDRLKVTCQLVNALATFHVPQTHSRVKRCTGSNRYQSQSCLQCRQAGRQAWATRSVNTV